MEILTRILPKSLPLCSNWLRHLHVLQPLPVGTPRGAAGNQGYKTWLEMSWGVPGAGRDFGYLSDSVIVVVSFPCLIKVELSLQPKEKQAPVITQVMRNAGNGGISLTLPIWEAAYLKSTLKKKNSKQKNSNNYDSLRCAKFRDYRKFTIQCIKILHI